MSDPQRRQRARDLLHRQDLDALVFCQPENIRYLCGFTGSDGVVILVDGQLVFLTDSRYTTQAQTEVAADRVETYQNKTDGIIAALTDLSSRRVGVEASLTVDLYHQLRDKGAADWLWHPLQEEIQSLRLHKSDAEVRAIKAAADLNRAGFEEIQTLIRPGVREKVVALALEFALRRGGADEKAFDFIVASGVRGAMPHGVATDKVLAAGELVTIDFGCRCAGYHSDETITLALGEVTGELRRIHDLVLEAHDLAINAVAPGVALAELDRLAREHIAANGYGECFGHGLGHGVGLEVHEAPVVSPRSQMKAEPGMVFTVEPGIYVPDLGGVRIEDMVLVTAVGHELLTKIPKTFRNILLN